MEKETAVEGKLIDWNGKPVAGVKIVASIQVEAIQDYEHFETVTKSDGSFRMDGLFPSSEYVLQPWSEKWSSEAFVRVETAPQGETRVLTSPMVIEEAITSDGSGVTDLATGATVFMTPPKAPQAFDGIEFVQIPAGSFTMGSPENEAGRGAGEAQRRVTLSQGFWLGKYEVTQAQWTRVMGSNPSDFEGDNRPVDFVSWDAAQQFISKLNKTASGPYRLPTEAEWEYACRAGSTWAFAYGNRDGPLNNYSWYSANSGRNTHAVGRKKPNAWGLYDMHGNVWEWCQDWYGDYPVGDATDPAGPSSGQLRVLRGGSWAVSAINCRAAYRPRNTPGYRYISAGFRVVRTC